MKAREEPRNHDIFYFDLVRRGPDPEREQIVVAGYRTLSLIRLYPYAVLLGFPDQLIPEVGVGDGDEQFCPFPGAAAYQVDHAVFGDHVVGLAAGIRDDVPIEGGDDPGTKAAAFISLTILVLALSIPLNWLCTRCSLELKNRLSRR